MNYNHYVIFFGLSYYVYHANDLRNYSLSRFCIDDTNDSGDKFNKVTMNHESFFGLRCRCYGHKIYKMTIITSVRTDIASYRLLSFIF